MDVLTEIYVSSELWDELKRMDDNAELCEESICLLNCTLSVKLMSDGSGRYVLKLIK